MRPMLFAGRGFEVWSYAAMLYLGLIAGLVAENLGAHVMNLAALQVFEATLILLGPAILGARLFYVVTHWPQYRLTPERIFRRGEGGLSMYGGLPVMLLSSLPILKIFRLHFGAFWDAATLAILAGIGFTKIGCLLHGCCAGRCSQSKFAIFLPDARGIWKKRIPVQVLEAAWAMVLLGASWMALKRLPFRGALFLGAAAWYGAGRMVLENFREREAGLSSFAGGKIPSMVVAISATALLILCWPQ